MAKVPTPRLPFLPLFLMISKSLSLSCYLQSDKSPSSFNMLKKDGAGFVGSIKKLTNKFNRYIFNEHF